MSSLKPLVCAALLGLTLQACATGAEYDSLEFETTGFALSGYDDAIVTPEQIVIPAGIVQPVKATVEFKGDRYLIGSFVELESQNEALFAVFPMAEKNTFLLAGRKPGVTCVDVIVNGHWEECIDVTVE